MAYNTFERRSDDPTGDVYFLGAHGVYGPVRTGAQQDADATHWACRCDFLSMSMIGPGGVFERRYNLLGTEHTVYADGEAALDIEKGLQDDSWFLIEANRRLVRKLVGPRVHISNERGKCVLVARSACTDTESSLFVRLSHRFRPKGLLADAGEETGSSSKIAFVDSKELGVDLALVLAALALFG